MSAPQAVEFYEEAAPARDEAVGAEAILRRLKGLDLPSEDGIPLETNWHRIQMNLLIDSVHHLWHDRQDYFVGGNMFIYFSAQQARNRDYRGPDFFVVKNTDGISDRDSWIVWEERGRYPDVIVELASQSTIATDLGLKKRLYEQTFRTPEYFCYDPLARELFGWRLDNGSYVRLRPDGSGRLRSRELGVRLGTWEGRFQRIPEIWLRFYTNDGQLVLTPNEAEARRAETEARRAEAAEVELDRLRSLLAAHGITDVQK